MIPFSAGEMGLAELAPCSDWSKMDESDHFVQLYETDVFLLNSLGGFIGTGLEAGDACIVVATKEHREELDGGLKARGVDVALARASGQYVSLDAAETLLTFTLDGAPEPGRFAEIVGSLIARAAAGPRAGAAGRYASWVPAEPLWPFPWAGAPGPGRFAEIVGSLIARAAAGRSRV